MPRQARENHSGVVILNRSDAALSRGRHARSPTLPDVSVWDDVRRHVVTGKGGTGKTTVAASLALALATGGRQVLLIEVEGRQGLAQLFDIPPLPYEERALAVAPDGGDVIGLAIDAHQAMYEYLDMYYRLGRAGRALDRMGVVDFATTVAPGLRDVLLTGKTYEATRRTDNGNYVYDAVVLDAPPTGRITRFLNVTAAVTSLARVGPVNRHATSTMELIRSHRTAVHLVTLLEEMPVQETAGAIDELNDAEIPVGSIIVNQVRHSHLTARARSAARGGNLDRDAISAGLDAAGVQPIEATVDRLVNEAAAHAHRVALEETQRKAVTALRRPTYELPHLANGVDLAALYDFANTLREQGVA
jgi:anion-transporting  ArsA/GET3 family ATPase